jgi:hypothetical protein
MAEFKSPTPRSTFTTIVNSSVFPFSGGKFGETVSKAMIGLPKTKVKMPQNKTVQIQMEDGIRKSYRWGVEVEQSLRTSGTEKPAPSKKKKRFKSRMTGKRSNYLRWMFQRINKEEQYSKSDGRNLKQRMNIQQQIWNSGNEDRTTGGEEAESSKGRHLFARLMGTNHQPPQKTCNIHFIISLKQLRNFGSFSWSQSQSKFRIEDNSVEVSFT